MLHTRLEFVGSAMVALWAQAALIPFDSIAKNIGVVIGLSLVFWAIARKAGSVAIDAALGDYAAQKRAIAELRTKLDEFRDENRRAHAISRQQVTAEIAAARADMGRDFRAGMEALAALKLEFHEHRAGQTVQNQQVERRVARLEEA